MASFGTITVTIQVKDEATPKLIELSRKWDRILHPHEWRAVQMIGDRGSKR